MKNICNIINVFTVTFEQFTASVLNKSINIFFFLTNPKMFNPKLTIL